MSRRGRKNPNKFAFEFANHISRKRSVIKTLMKRFSSNVSDEKSREQEQQLI